MGVGRGLSSNGSVFFLKNRSEINIVNCQRVSNLGGEFRDCYSFLFQTLFEIFNKITKWGRGERNGLGHRGLLGSENTL